MTRPAIFDAIDAFIADYVPKGIKASSDDRVFPDVCAMLGLDYSARIAAYEGVNITRSTAVIPDGPSVNGSMGGLGWRVLKPSEQWRRSTDAGDEA